MIRAAPIRSMRCSPRAHGRNGRQTPARIRTKASGLMAAAHPDAFTLIDRSASVAAARVRPAPQNPRRRPRAHHPRLRRASGAHRIDGVGTPLALALHALLAGNLTFAGGIERGVANLDLTLSLVLADDQAIRRNAGP